MAGAMAGDPKLAMAPLSLPPERTPFYDKLLFATFVLFLPPLMASTPGLFADGDVSWHVAAGRWILERGAIPATDPFSWTMAGQPWVAHEWLAEVLLGGAYGLGGFAGLAALVSVALMLLHLALFLHLRARVGHLAMLAGFVAMDMILAKFLLARPHVLVWPLVAVWTAVLLDCREKGRPPPPALALLMLVWTNLHGSFGLGFVIAAAIGLDAMIESRWERARFLGWLNFGLLAAIGGMLNANGIDGLLHPLAIMGMDTLHLIDEWNPSRPADSPLFYIAVACAALAIALSRARFRLGEAALLVVMLALALAQIRHQSWLAIVGALIVTSRVAAARSPSLPATFSSRGDARGWLSGAAIIAALLVTARLLVPIEPREGPGYPRRLLAAIPPDLRSQPLLNEYSFGGPLILAGIRPFIDGRADMYGDRFMRDYRAAVEGDWPRFEQAVRRYGIRWTMLQHRNKLVKSLDSSPQWRRVYSDRIGVIHVRAGAAGPAPPQPAR